MDRDLQKSLKRIERLEEIEAQERHKRQKARDKAEKLAHLAGCQMPVAPEYFPTEDEFADPLAYIASIESEASRYGMCKIVPPESWKPDFQPRFTAVPDNPALFYTKRQVVTKKLLVPLDQEHGLAFRIEVQDGYRFFDLATWEKHASFASLKRSEVANLQDETRKEEQFWKTIAETDRFTVQYGSDMAGSASTEAFGPWELTGLANRSMLDSIRGGGLPDICGVNLPMLYIGQLFSMFAWHYEDNALQAINYHHKGSTKTWYAVPGSAAGEVEAVARGLFEGDATAAETINKVTMLSPSVLAARSVPVFRLRQRPGELVVTFPLAHHAGFSHGFTVGEAVNFAMPSWVPYGFASLQRYKGLGRESVLDLEQTLLWHLDRRVQRRQPLPVALAQAGALLMRWQLAVLQAAAGQNVGVGCMTRKQRGAAEQTERVDQRLLCCHPRCRHTLHLCFLVSAPDPTRRACPEHAALLRGAAQGDIKLFLRYPRHHVVALYRACRAALRAADGHPAEPHPEEEEEEEGEEEEDGDLEAEPHRVEVRGGVEEEGREQEERGARGEKSSCSVCKCGGHNRRTCPQLREGAAQEAATPSGRGGAREVKGKEGSGAGRGRVGALGERWGQVRGIGGEVVMDFSAWDPAAEARRRIERQQEQEDDAGGPRRRRRRRHGEVASVGAELSFPRSPFFAVPVTQGRAGGGGGNRAVKAEC